MHIEQLPKDAYIVQISGGREWNNVYAICYELSMLPANSIIIHGACRGADLLAAQIADELRIPSVACPAHWDHNNKDWVAVHGPCPEDCRQIVGNAAGPLRNLWMLDTYKADVVLAFHENLAKSKGTAHLVKEATKRNTTCKVISK